jgi:DNA (cytosine-5)-methyltransferase 1
MPIKIIDAFSGPGGLGEGFTSLKGDNGNHPFKIAVSIEKDASAHRTLKLRSFFRQFSGKAPEEYYAFLKGELDKTPEEALYKIPEFSEQANAAERETLQLELGKNNRVINKKIEESLGSDECILIGGPPCQAYSLAGRSRNMGNKEYNPNDDHRNFLYKEYLKIIAQFQPMVFVMENVKGMLSAKIDGEYIYESLFKDLHNPCKATKVKPKRGFSGEKYKIFSLVTPNDDGKDLKAKDYIIRSEFYGIPQRRHRVILLGIREDLANKWSDTLLLNEKPQTSISDVIGDLPKLRSGLSKGENTHVNWSQVIKAQLDFSIKVLENGSLNNIAEELIKISGNFSVPTFGQGKNLGLTRNGKMNSTNFQSWFYDDELGEYICNHETRGHITGDLQRYLFCSMWAKVGHKENWKSLTPKSGDYPTEFIPKHKNFTSGKFADRFRVQPWSIPATTITSHISKDGHYYIHPDPPQCRSFTVREAARIQTFPDNYFFVGTRTQQYVQVGNAVPPYLATQIADIVFSLLKTS